MKLFLLMIELKYLDYKLFQEIVVGKELLLNAPIDSITSKSIGGSETRTESELQYLRLWMSDDLQTIMYFANHSIPAGLYMEHNSEKHQI